jgi:hypothetical protein
MVCLSGYSAWAQNQIALLNLNTSTFIVPNSLYSTIDCINSKQDSNFIGVLSTGILFHKATILNLPSPPGPSLSPLLNSMVDGSAKDGALLFQWKRFGFVESTGTRYCYLNVALYAKTGDRYQPLSELDTLYIVRGSAVSMYLGPFADSVVSHFLGKALQRHPTDTTTYSLDDVLNIDSLEKTRIPLYTATSYSNGIYYNYASFRNQVPDLRGTVSVKKEDNFTTVKVTDSLGNKVKVKPRNSYAYVADGTPYIATPYNFYPLSKVNNDFIFTGDIKIAASEASMRNAGLFLGLAGSMAASGGMEETYELMLDYHNGQFIHLSQYIRPDAN